MWSLFFWIITGKSKWTLFSFLLQKNFWNFLLLLPTILFILVKYIFDYSFLFCFSNYLGLHHCIHAVYNNFWDIKQNKQKFPRSISVSILLSSFTSDTSQLNYILYPNYVALYFFNLFFFFFFNLEYLFLCLVNLGFPFFCNYTMD